MRKMIRKWLGVDALETEVKQIEIPSEESIRKMVGPAIEAALNEDPSYTNYFFGSITRVRNKITAAIEEEVARLAQDRISEMSDKRVDSEEFLDQIVERIQRKQVS